MLIAQSNKYTMNTYHIDFECQLNIGIIEKAGCINENVNFMEHTFNFIKCTP